MPSIVVKRGGVILRVVVCGDVLVVPCVVWFCSCCVFVCVTCFSPADSRGREGYSQDACRWTYRNTTVKG